MLRGRYPVPHRKGLIPTSDGAGEVVEVGAGVDDFKVADRVMGIFHPRWYGGRMPPNVSRFGYGSEIDRWLVERKVLGRRNRLSASPMTSPCRVVDVPLRRADCVDCAASTARRSLRPHRADPRDRRRLGFRAPVGERRPAPP